MFKTIYNHSLYLFGLFENVNQHSIRDMFEFVYEEDFFINVNLSFCQNVFSSLSFFGQDRYVNVLRMYWSSLFSLDSWKSSSLTTISECRFSWKLIILDHPSSSVIIINIFNHESNSITTNVRQSVCL